ncbi:MAG: non-hydrolyzing UDP-N-acetylglucosamine 2-epimerase [Flavobacteriales bacterium]
MMRLATIVGARPQFIKAAALSRAIGEHFNKRISEILVHTGQHFDHNMSQVFFDELEIEPPSYSLTTGAGTHGAQTAAMLAEVEKVLLYEKPDAVLVYGDTNSTLAGALAAAKLHMPLIHVEAGIRSFNKMMPEEINRVTCDHLSSILFTPSDAGVLNLQSEGLTMKNFQKASINNPVVYRCGDIMLDVSMHAAHKVSQMSLSQLGIAFVNEDFAVCTIHRDSNTDDEKRLHTLLETLCKLIENIKIDIVFPLHPRTAKSIGPSGLQKLKLIKGLHVTEPLSYFDMQLLLQHCKLVLTDSGGLQKEAYFSRKPVIVLRSETEWIELVDSGFATVCDADETRIIDAAKHYMKSPPAAWPALYGDGRAAHFICEKILAHLNS